MRIVFNKTYLCCGCGRRYVASDVSIAYKGSCICNDCFDKLDKVSPKSMFESIGKLDFVSAAFYYTNMYRRIFINYKFHDHLIYGHVLAIAIREYFSSFSELSSYDCIIPVPLSSKRQKSRGFNQSEIFAQYISQAIGVPVQKSLKRLRNEEPQSRLSSVERAVNVRDAFFCEDDLRGLDVILVDDIYTTGNTMKACASAVCDAGAKSVCGAVGAYVYKKERNTNKLPHVVSDKYRKYTVKYNKGT